MKLLFDENLSHRLLKSACQPWPDSKHVRDVGLESASDSEVWDFAKKNDFIIISKDTDFCHRSSVYGHPPKVIWVRAGNCSTKAVKDLILNSLMVMLLFGNNTDQSFLGIPDY